MTEKLRSGRKKLLTSGAKCRDILPLCAPCFSLKEEWTILKDEFGSKNRACLAYHFLPWNLFLCRDMGCPWLCGRRTVIVHCCQRLGGILGQVCFRKFFVFQIHVSQPSFIYNNLYLIFWFLVDLHLAKKKKYYLPASFKPCQSYSW